MRRFILSAVAFLFFLLVVLGFDQEQAAGQQRPAPLLRVYTGKAPNIAQSWAAASQKAEPEVQGITFVHLERGLLVELTAEKRTQADVTIPLPERPGSSAVNPVTFSLTRTSRRMVPRSSSAEGDRKEVLLCQWVGNRKGDRGWTVQFSSIGDWLLQGEIRSPDTVYEVRPGPQAERDGRPVCHVIRVVKDVDLPPCTAQPAEPKKKAPGDQEGSARKQNSP